MAASKKIAKAVATVTAYSIFTKILSFIFKIYLSRELGAEVIGLYQICISVFFLFASLSSSGLPLVLSRKIAESRALDHSKQERDLLSSTLIMGLCLTISCILILYLLKNHLSILFSDKRSLPLFLVMIPALLTTTIYSIIRSYFWGRKEFNYFAFTEMLEEVLRIVFSVFLISGVISAITGAYTVIYAFLISDILIAIVLIALYIHKGGRFSKGTKFKEIFFPSLPLTAMRVFGSLSITFIALLLPYRLMQSGISMNEATAIYGRISGMAAPLMLAPMSLIGSMSIVLIPEMSEKGIKKEYLGLNKQVNSALEFSILISGLFMLAYIALGEEITVLIFKDSQSGKYLEVACLIMLPISVSQITQSAIHSLGLERKSFTNYMIGSIFLFLSIYFLPPYIGMYSVAVATFLSLFVTTVLNIIVLIKHTNFDLTFMRTLFIVIVLIVPSSYFTKTLNSLINPYLGVISVLISISAGMAMYCILNLMLDTVRISSFNIRKA